MFRKNRILIFELIVVMEVCSMSTLVYEHG